jgi:hypothetical protein
MQAMVDIETLGIIPGAPILSIGAVLFDLEGIHAEYHDNTFFLEGSPELSTVEWWLAQSPEALAGVSTPRVNTFSYAIRQLGDFLEGFPVWGNGSDFDNVHLAYWFRKFGYKWDHRRNRDFRTMKNLFPVDYQFEGVRHNALDDAKSQALRLISICKTYGVKLG